MADVISETTASRKNVAFDFFFISQNTQKQEQPFPATLQCFWINSSSESVTGECPCLQHRRGVRIKYSKAIR